MNEHQMHNRSGRRGRRQGGGGPRAGRGRGRRGNVRSALLVALLDGPAHGYELIQALEAKTGGRWRPSPGSVYPSLQMLADEGLVTSAEVDGKRVFELTDAGVAEARERKAAHESPWEAMAGRGAEGGLRVAMRDLSLAVKQVAVTGRPEDVERTSTILSEARREVLRLLLES